MNAKGSQHVPGPEEEKGKPASKQEQKPQAGEIAGVIRHASAKRYPRVDYLEGQCILASRDVLNSIGCLDEAVFSSTISLVVL